MLIQIETLRLNIFGLSFLRNIQQHGTIVFNLRYVYLFLILVVLVVYPTKYQLARERKWTVMTISSYISYSVRYQRFVI